MERNKLVGQMTTKEFSNATFATTASAVLVVGLALEALRVLVGLMFGLRLL